MDAVVGAAASRYVVPDANTSVAVAPVVGCVYTPEGYVVKAEIMPAVVASVGPLHPVVNEHAEVQVEQFVASPYVLATAPVAAHCTNVISVQELAPAIEEEPIGQATTAEEPVGQ